MRAHIRIATPMLLLVATLVPALALATASAEVIHVCWDGSGDYLTIQEGIDAAVDGDEVVVCDGTYTGPGNRDLDFHGKAITVRSENGPDNCVIDCQGSESDPHRGFYFHNGETGEAVVRGFTITNGYATCGAGICCESGSLTISGCVIMGNTVLDRGGGVYAWSGGLTILNCAVSGNRAGCGDGAGGGIYCYNCDSTIRDCSVTDNTAADNGGGITCGGGMTVISNCIIAGNTAEQYFGGGVHFETGDLTLTNCAITGNTARSQDEFYGGGAISCLYGSARIESCTIVRNTTYGAGGGFFCYKNNPMLRNCLLWQNVALLGPEAAVIYQLQPATLSVFYCDVAGGEGAVYVDNRCTLIWGPGNVDADPLFVDPDGEDFHLLAGSPCIDAGCNGGVPADSADLDEDGDTIEVTPLDLDGEGRFFDDPDTPDSGCGCPPIVDMGAYEFGGSGLQPCPGDLDCDREVDQSDLGVLLAAWQATDAGDLNCDGITDTVDLGILLAHWGEGCP